MFRARSSRALTLLLVLTGSVRASASGPDLSALEEKFSRLVDRARGQVGVSLIHVESGATLAVGVDQRFPMASVYKLPIAIELLSQIAQGCSRGSAP